MAKMTIAELEKFVKEYVLASKQAGDWVSTTDNLYKLVDKIGKQITLDGLFQDKLPELDGDNLPYGATIEEYFADLILPEAYSDEADPLAKHLITTQEPSYSYTMGRKVLKATVPYDNVERAALGGSEASDMLTRITKRLSDSEAEWKYNVKRQLIANMIAKAEAAANKDKMVETLAKPVDTATGEAFIQRVKELKEVASESSEGNNLANCLIGAAPSLVLYVKQGVIPSLQVNTLAGVFNKDELGLGVEVKVIKDFGDNASGVYAVLMDPRGVKLHNHYNATRSQENGDADYVNFFRHIEDTGFISKFTFFHAFKAE